MLEAHLLVLKEEAEMAKEEGWWEKYKWLTLSIIVLLGLLFSCVIAQSNASKNLPERPSWDDPTMGLDIDDPYY